MFFKKKTDVEDYCTLNLKTLFSSEREVAFEKSRQASADPALIAANQKLYFDNLRAVIIELIQIAISKNSGFDVSSNARMFVMMYFTQHGLSGLEAISRVYNHAFGQHPQDGIAGIVEAFSREVTGSRMRPETAQLFYAEFYALLGGLFNDFKSVKLTTKRR